MPKLSHRASAWTVAATAIAAILSGTFVAPSHCYGAAVQPAVAVQPAESVKQVVATKSWIPELPPPAEYGPRDLGPMLARLPKHKVGTPFASLSLGLQINSKLISADSWQLPGVGSTFDPQPTSGFTSLSLSLGGFVLHGHAEVYATIPLVGFEADYGNNRTLSIGYLNLGTRLYPWALQANKIRPFFTIGVARRTLSFSAVADVPSDVTTRTAWVLPVGIGAGFLTRFGLLIDVSAQVVIGDSATLMTGVDAQPLDQLLPNASAKEIDISGMRLSLGMRWVRGLWSQTADENFARNTAKRMLLLKDAKLLSGITVALGPTFQALSNSGNYFSSRRRYLSEAYKVSPMPELAVGWHSDPLDAEIRLAFRYFRGSASGYGAKLETSSAIVLLEAFKKFDVGFYGITPWVGVGIGAGAFSNTDTAPSGVRAFDQTKVVFSLPFGWDYRMDPSSWWLLRTSLRWLPTVAVDLDSGVTFDHGGLEVNVISLVVMPQRWLAMRRGLSSTKSRHLGSSLAYTADNANVNGLVCDGTGTCRTLPRAGEPCLAVAGKSAVCARGWSCESGTCVIRYRTF